MTAAAPTFSTTANTVKIPASTGVSSFIDNVAKTADGSHKLSGTRA